MDFPWQYTGAQWSPVFPEPRLPRFLLQEAGGGPRYCLPLAVSRTGPGGLALRSTKSSMETVYSSFPGA
jgi:hypothetical protein